ncbi:hypothetical protein [Streptacidiphilus sp. P02-A3a]|uniref:hypothetical protein n=1 Tax=Streptacidiphilus sp. P02-A3a TaxID=2704468 RepID=UPI0015FDB407|nr:hypothetical protein [Streptacidiphilus sp. P02-A3a]QMU68148.1 hypothetical protein GXP74_07845 [Streptacidiphilus sp. P02-A3a]
MNSFLPSLFEIPPAPVARRTLRLYGRYDVALLGPEEFLDAVADHFWPQAAPVATVPGMPLVELLRGRSRPSALTGHEQQPITLHHAPDGDAPDSNEGIHYPTAAGVDRLVADPRTGSFVAVSGSRIQVVNADAELGLRDALRVVEQLVSTGFEAEGVHTLHASAFAVGGGAVAVSGPKGSGRTTTTLAAVAAGARLVGNERLYARTDDASTTVWGWTDPVRLVDAASAARTVLPLSRYLSGDATRLALGPLPLAAVVVPRVGAATVPIRCEELDPAAGRAAIGAEVLPPRARWLGLEPQAAPSAATPVAPRYLRLSYGHRDAAAAAALLLDVLGAPAQPGAQPLVGGPFDGHAGAF